MSLGCNNFGNRIDLDATRIPTDVRLTKTQRLADGHLTDGDSEVIESLEDFATQRGHMLVELVVSWLLARPPMASVIAKATRPEQVQQNVRAGDWILTEEFAQIDRLCQASAA
jgi:aryl-alcohol dehydrogenase-like predicted oxidoreductase